MTDTFERFWARHGSGGNTLTNLFLAGPPPGGQQLLLAQYGCDGTGKDGRQAIANTFSDTLNDPGAMVDLLADPRRAREFIARATGQPWIVPVIRGGLAIGLQQVREKLGLPPDHPKAPAQSA